MEIKVTHMPKMLIPDPPRHPGGLGCADALIQAVEDPWRSLGSCWSVCLITAPKYCKQDQTITCSEVCIMSMHKQGQRENSDSRPDPIWSRSRVKPRGYGSPNQWLLGAAQSIHIPDIWCFISQSLLWLWVIPCHLSHIATIGIPYPIPLPASLDCPPGFVWKLGNVAAINFPKIIILRGLYN